MGKLNRHYEEVIQPCWSYAGRIKTADGHEQMALVGMAAEAGEALDIGKKWWWHSQKPWEAFREKMLSELGDVIFYWLKAVHVFGFTVDEVLDYNRKKLASRHPELGEVGERFGKDAIRG